MGKAYKIIRRSIHAFFLSYHSLVSAAALLALPVSAAILLSQLPPSSSSVSRTMSFRLASLFRAAGLPSSSQFFSFLNLKLCQSLFSFFTTLPFTLTFLIFAKASAVRIVQQSPRGGRLAPPFASLVRSYCLLLPTHLFNSFLILSANAAIFSILFLAFNAAEILNLSSSNSILVLSAAGAVLYSIVLANAMAACNLAIVVSATEGCGGYLAFLKACVLIRGQESTAISVALPVNLVIAGIEALFQYRVVKPYHGSSKLNPSVILEALLITYLHSLIVVLDVVVSCKLFQSCKAAGIHQSELEPEEKGALQA